MRNMDSRIWTRHIQYSPNNAWTCTPPSHGQVITHSPGIREKLAPIFHDGQCDPANNVEAYSPNPGTGVGAGIGSLGGPPGAVVGAVVGTIVVGIAAWWLAETIVDSIPDTAPPPTSPWYKDPTAPKEPSPQPKPRPVPDPRQPPKQPPTGPSSDGNQEHPCKYECSCCPPKMMEIIVFGFSGNCPNVYEWTCPDGKAVVCYLKGYRRP